VEFASTILTNTHYSWLLYLHSRHDQPMHSQHLHALFIALCTHEAMHTRCTHDAHTMHTRCTHDARTWCTHDAHTMHTWCTHMMYTHDAHTMHTRCTHDAHTSYTLIRLLHDMYSGQVCGTCVDISVPAPCTSSTSSTSITMAFQWPIS
jgi:hypothetical protein